MSSGINASPELEKAESSMDSLSRVPPEIFCHIFEELKDDKNTLSSSSSVSRYWREVSLPWLFTRIDVPSTSRLTGFLAFLRTHPHLRAHVRQLCFRPLFKRNPTIPESRIRTFMSSAISGFPALRALSLINVILAPDGDFGHPSTLPLIDIEPETPSTLPLQRLSIVCSAGAGCWTSTLIWFLSRYAVSTLRLIGVEIVVPGDLEAASAVKCLNNSLRVSKLVLDTSDCRGHGVYTFLEKVLQPSSVRSVTVSCESSSNMVPILNFMRAIGQNVMHVCLDLASLTALSFPSDSNWAMLGQSLTFCPCLERLHIRLPVFMTAEDSSFPCLAIFTAILPYASRMLQTLTIELVDEIHWRCPGGWEIWDFNALAAYLTHKPVEFPSLRSVSIEFRMVLPEDNRHLIKILLREMSPLEDVGLLRIFCDNKWMRSYPTRLGIEPLPTYEVW